RRDPIKPRPKRRAAFEAVEAAPRADERLLHRVLCLERRGEHPVAVRLQLGAVLLELLLERRGLGGPDRGSFHGGQSYAPVGGWRDGTHTRTTRPRPGTHR